VAKPGARHLAAKLGPAAAAGVARAGRHRALEVAQLGLQVRLERAAQARSNFTLGLAETGASGGGSGFELPSQDAKEVAMIEGLIDAWSTTQFRIASLRMAVGGDHHERDPLFGQLRSNRACGLSVQVEVQQCSVRPLLIEQSQGPTDSPRGSHDFASLPPQEALDLHGDEHFILDDQDATPLQRGMQGVDCYRPS
jgi:hypothetical protein